ncbi:hypothetical protein PENSTE_c008G02909 [Penicillium steckii]|uniref:Carrier domain-containing protein n=1 Tax=Penicillium steckii TaxID=303698 RepID=A0A1V6TBJ1_9EURO|nr:hypothetical protein PENSTE_c008G02909 [Penicillium steckii]
MPSEKLTYQEEYDLLVCEGQGLGQIFEAQARQSPNAIAIIDDEVTFTYCQLHFYALNVAHELRLMCLEAEEPVGIIVRHGLADIVAQIAIIYAGGTCAPMDPTLPDAQIESRLNRLGARFFLVDKSNVERKLPFRHVNVDDHSLLTGKVNSFLKSDIPVATDIYHRTHFIHTSGTTSEPKAVQIVARSILQVVYHAPFEPVSPADTVAHINNTSFDVSLFDIWVPLLRGARIAVLSKVILLDLPAMAAAIAQKGITIMATTAALLNLAASTYPRAFSQLRICFIGGEAANMTAIETIFQHGPPQRLINAYGPTECCIFCLAHQVTQEDIINHTVSIGKPIGRTIAYICDDYGELVDDGQEGELWIGGAGVSPGYLNDPEKNEKSFAYMQTDQGEKRFYRTGDRVKRRSDGQIDYVGRQDHQVKVRGYRIELEAVESAMLRTGQFSETAALKVEANGGAGSILVAFAVPISSKPHAVISAIDSLKSMLPEYMVPQIELIPKMPLNSHAKVDRKHLARLYRERWANLPSTNNKDLEFDTKNTTQRLASLWVEILGLPRLPEDTLADFFKLGATSLQASLLISRIRKHFQSDVSLLALYDHSTLGALTSIIEKSHNGSSETVRNEQDIWIQDTQIGDDLAFPSRPVIDWRRDTEGRVFFTGGTGFVGAFLLADLLRAREVRQVGCLVRATNSEEGLDRLKQALGKYGQWEERFTDKLLILCGSLEDVYLGFGYERFHEIASWASVIFHLGAKVNYTQPYSLHRPANVLGTRNIVRLACAGGRTKAVHYVSSISCFGPTGFVTGAKVIMEDEPLLKHVKALPFDHGYAQSQWVAEGLLRRLMERQFPIAIYRPGFITGHSQTGACNPDDFFSRLIQSCAQIGSYPLLPNQSKEFVPVDYVNKIILHIASASGSSSLGYAYHIVPPSQDTSIDMNETMDLVATTSKRSIKGITYKDWAGALIENCPSRLQPLLPMLAERAHQGLTRWELYENMPVYDSTNTARLLKQMGVSLEFPVLDQRLMGKYLDFLSDC